MSVTLELPDSLLGPIFGAASDSFVATNATGMICQVNDACLQLLGYTREELLGQPIERLIPQRFSDHARRRQTYAESPHPRSMESGLELCARHKDGQEIQIDIALTPLTLDGERYFVASLRDMRKHASAIETLNVQATALRSAANGVVITDRDGWITWVNPAATRITGYAESELIGAHTRVLKSGVHDTDFYGELWATVSRGETWSGTIINRRKDGSHYAEEQTIAPVRDGHGVITHFIAIKQDISARLAAESALAHAREELAGRLEEIEELNSLLSEQAVRDPLTGLHNRRYFRDAIARALADAREKELPVAIAMLDVDHFKGVNDSHGHMVGDEVLVALAGVLRKGVRCSDLICRFGGEEFVVVLVGTSLDAAVQRAEALRMSFGELSFSGGAGSTFRCSVSIGLTDLRSANESITELVERADEALYEAKQRGRNQVVVAPQGRGAAAFGMP